MKNDVLLKYKKYLNDLPETKIKKIPTVIFYNIENYNAYIEYLDKMNISTENVKLNIL